MDDSFKTKPRLVLILGILLSLLSIIFIWTFLKLYSKNKTPISPQISNFPTQAVVSKISRPTPIENVFHFLLLGQGDPGHEGAYLTDALMVFRLDIKNNKAALISLPRDLWVILNGKEEKINRAYSLGGFPLVEEAVSVVTGLPINQSVLIDFNQFQNLINQLGKIEVSVPKTFDDYYYPIRGKELDNCEMAPETLVAINATMSGFQLEKQYSCRYEHLHFDAGPNLMTGEEALKFVRSRHSNQDGSDFARGIRQQAVLIGLKNKLLDLKAWQNLPKYWDKFIGLVKTNLDKETALAIGEMIVTPQNYQITKIGLSTQNVLSEGKGSGGQYILYPKSRLHQWTEIHGYINNQLNSK